MSEKRVTLRDVAAAAGVSRATAGFVLSDAPGIAISEATRRRVRETAGNLGYVPHSIARALREGSSRIIVLTIDSGYEGNYSRSFTVALPDGHPPLGPVRLRFAREAASRVGLPPPEALTVSRERARAAAAVLAFLDAHPEVTALADFDDEVALRILAAARDLGLSVPGDLAVIGFDDTDYGALFTPTLTTVHIDAEDHGRRTARIILGLDGAGFVAAPAQVIVRESA